MVKITRLFGTPWCSDCKVSKSFLADHRIDYKYIDISENEEAAKFVESINDGKRKVPTIEFSDGTFLVEPSNVELAKKLDIISRPSKPSYEVLIIGSGPAGLTCAIYTAREGLDTVVIEKSALGGRMNFTDRIENYPGFPEGIDGIDLAAKFTKQSERFDVELLKATEATKIEREGDIFAVKTSHGDTIKAKTVVIATGSKYRTLGTEGETTLLGYKIHFCAVCDGPFYKDKKVLVMGGGNSALEESLFLARFASEVMVAEIMDDLTATKTIQEQVAQEPKIKTFTSYEIKEYIVGEKKKLEGVRFFDRANNKQVTLKPDGVFLLVGLKPNTEITEGVVEMDQRGFIKTDEKLMTNIPGIFAIGDCRSKSTQQVASAVGEGAIVVFKIREHLKNH